MFNFLKRRKSNNDPNQMGLIQRLAMKRLEKMSPEEKNKLAQKMMAPENIEKNKDKINEVLSQMKLSGQINDDQIEEAKRKLGL